MRALTFQQHISHSPSYTTAKELYPGPYGRLGSWDSGRRQHPGAEDFVFAERLKRGIGNGNYGQRVTQRVEHLGTVPFSAIGREVVFHRLHDVTAFEAVFRQVLRQHHIFLTRDQGMRGLWPWTFLIRSMVRASSMSSLVSRIWRSKDVA